MLFLNELLNLLLVLVKIILAILVLGVNYPSRHLRA